jgi:hypothetical protein
MTQPNGDNSRIHTWKQEPKYLDTHFILRPVDWRSGSSWLASFLKGSRQHTQASPYKFVDGVEFILCHKEWSNSFACMTCKDLNVIGMGLLLLHLVCPSVRQSRGQEQTQLWSIIDTSSSLCLWIFNTVRSRIDTSWYYDEYSHYSADWKVVNFSSGLSAWK